MQEGYEQQLYLFDDIAPQEAQASDVEPSLTDRLSQIFPPFYSRMMEFSINAKRFAQGCANLMQDYINHKEAGNQIELPSLIAFHFPTDQRRAMLNGNYMLTQFYILDEEMICEAVPLVDLSGISAIEMRAIAELAFEESGVSYEPHNLDSEDVYALRAPSHNGIVLIEDAARPIRYNVITTPLLFSPRHIDEATRVFNTYANAVNDYLNERTLEEVTMRINVGQERPISPDQIKLTIAPPQIPQ